MNNLNRKYPDTMKNIRRKQFVRHGFTLVELLVAMAIFAVLMLLSAQIFTASQTMWSRSEQKNSAFASGRTVMEFVASRIQTIAYSDETPFLITGKTTSTDGGYYKKVYLPTAMPMNRKKNGKDIDKVGVRFINFFLDDTSTSDTFGHLKMHIYSDEGSRDFKYLFPPYDSSSGFVSALTKIKGKCDNPGGDEDMNKISIVENVTKLKFIPFNVSGSGRREKIKRDVNDTHIVNPPYLLEVEISLIDTKEHFELWKNESDQAKKDEIEQQYGYTFRRAILLGDRRKDK